MLKLHVALFVDYNIASLINRVVAANVRTLSFTIDNACRPQEGPPDQKHFKIVSVIVTTLF